METYNVISGMCELYSDEILKIADEIDNACEKEVIRVSLILGLRPEFNIYVNNYSVLSSFYQEKSKGKYLFKEDFLGKTLDINATVKGRGFKTKNLASLIMSDTGDGLTFFAHPVKKSLVDLEVIYPILKKYCSSISVAKIDF